MERVVLASGNAGKLAEMRDLLAGVGVDVCAQSAFQVTSIEETGLSFVENALLKARHCARSTGLPALADDSGLCVDALHGRPGIYSARYAGPTAGDADNNRKLLAALEAVPAEARKARYYCALVLVRDALDPTPLICEAYWNGRIVGEACGTGGFGYDPLFQPDGMDQCAAELSATEKNRRSHRGQAMQKLVRALRT